MEMNNWLRIGLRVFGAILFLGGLVFFAAHAIVGPSGVAEALGANCVSGDPMFNEAEQCTTWDVIGWLPEIGAVTLVGAVLLFALRKSKSSAPITFAVQSAGRTIGGNGVRSTGTASPPSEGPR